MTGMRIQPVPTRDGMSANINEAVRDSNGAVEAALAGLVDKLVDEFVRSAFVEAEAIVET